MTENNKKMFSNYLKNTKNKHILDNKDKSQIIRQRKGAKQNNLIDKEETNQSMKQKFPDSVGAYMPYVINESSAQ